MGLIAVAWVLGSCGMYPGSSATSASQRTTPQAYRDNSRAQTEAPPPRQRCACDAARDACVVEAQQGQVKCRATARRQLYEAEELRQAVATCRTRYEEAYESCVNTRAKCHDTLCMSDAQGAQAATERKAPEVLPSGVRRGRNRKGQVLLDKVIALDVRHQMRLLGSPEIEPSHIHLEFKVGPTGGDPPPQCDLEAMFGYDATTLVKGADAELRGGWRVLRARVPFLRMVQMVVEDQRFMLRYCDLRWKWGQKERAEFGAFADALLEEIGWARARSGGGGGAPEWKSGVADVPRAGAGKALDAREVFERVRQSVFVIYAPAPTEDLRASFGSAVAVSPRELLTNWHVVRGMSTVIVESAEQSFLADIVQADPETDRAVLKPTSESIVLKPVPGVRMWKSLHVGETVYTLGAPRGYDLTLSNGLLSALRPKHKVLAGGQVNVIQTSAPISPGSSGGGLFDGQGNLVGITTEQVAQGQNLNFAVAAEAFVKPGG